MIVSVFTITPETANGRGSIPLVTDGTVPVVGDQLAGPPPGVQGAMPGMEPGGAAGDVMAPVGMADVMSPTVDAVKDPAGAVGQ